MKDEKGLTLVELLVAIVILGIVLIPLLTIMMGTSVRTASNEKGSTNLYIARK
ncbi:PilW family protein [Alkalihalobacillus deserti]|uniref:PilW family protein n=1 Tax=Alkalihalobacillus deserti TaxID=2879466 RepID=UPI001D14AF94|nr:type II secretion system protein [Alkalihalobacillus deserti]